MAGQSKKKFILGSGKETLSLFRERSKEQSLSALDVGETAGNSWKLLDIIL